MRADRSSRVVRLAAALALLWTPAVFAGTESCVTCHPQAKTEFEGSAHEREFACSGCHGGDPEVLGVEAHEAEGFVGIPPRAEVPGLCAHCHADPARMKASGLPTDQYAQYQTSEHGKALAGGDTRVAVCTDCHGHHAILPADEPTSPVARPNAAATCGRCHSDHALMAPYGIPTDQEEQFRQSVHGVALYAQDHPAAPSCADCHGAHGATAMGASPRAACAHCHQRAQEYLDRGPHRAAVATGKMDSCTSCHGDHQTSPPSHELFDTACRGCHTPQSSEFATGQKLKTIFLQASESVDTASEELVEARKRFPTLNRLETYLLQGRAYLMESLPVQHSLALDEVEDLARAARSVADDVRSSIYGIRYTEQLRYMELAVMWIFIVLACVAAFLYRAELRRRRTEAPPDEVRDRES
jgi:hypothetical protein